MLNQVAECFGHAFHFEEFPLDARRTRPATTQLPESTLEACRKADAVLLGALDIGQSKDEAMFHAEAERGLLAVQRALGMLVTLRHVRPHPALIGLSPLRGEVLQGVDLVLMNCLSDNVAGRMRPGHCRRRRRRRLPYGARRAAITLPSWIVRRPTSRACGAVCRLASSRATRTCRWIKCRWMSAFSRCCSIRVTWT